MISGYVALASALVSGELAPQDFQDQYLELHRHDENVYGDERHEVLNILFYAAETYCADPNLRDAQDTDERGLVVAAKTFLVKQRELTWGEGE
ncbi:colicin immunity domain-containing protein [Lentzea californiensis]|uniref:colicin immunity domain-containing protein n=1 Tax=Lentzea californiensis TaxID=438851 RepID=UPI002165E52C|nr:colicin immunity domain-containing protein [Lentzea californiensis]